MLHVVAICPKTYSNEPNSTSDNAELKPLAELLDAQLWGMLPGFHRLVFEDGHVLLTLCIGDVTKLLRQQQFEADSINLSSAALAGTELLFAVKAIARLCKPATLLTTSNSEAMQAALSRCGFVITEHLDELKATYNPSWVTKKPKQSVKPGRCVVVGSGLAGAAVASSLARRGWTVTVLDAASEPASGASSLPAGILVAHTSPDDSPLSRLSRAGVRMTLQQARSVLRHGLDWVQTGVLQRNFSGERQQFPRVWTQGQSLAASDWCSPAKAKTLATAGLPTDSSALWHTQAGWVKPATLTHAWLKTPGITWRGDVKVAELAPSDEGWQVLDAQGHTLAGASLVVLAAGYASQALAVSAHVVQTDLQAIRGQVTFGLRKDSLPVPPFVVNGHGGLITAFSTTHGPMWLMGAGYERNVEVPGLKAQDHADNLTRLQSLLPDVALALAGQFSPQQARGWAGIRCATPNRLPRVGPLATADASPGLWLCTGLGSRGLSFACLCAELLAAQLHGEPLPIDSQLAKAMRAKSNTG
jgi:tRNA 5-methylaminomethyl-2-thiouridine biosynthesis bifunctional protein